MIIIGLTGGIASGKSYVAKLLAEQGAIVLDADKQAQQLLNKPQVLEQLIARWGHSIVDSEGKVIRNEIAKRVFGDQPKLVADRKFLESLIHPLVRQRLQTKLELATQRGVPAVVLDIPLLHEAGWTKSCDLVLFVETPDDIRQARASHRGWDSDELAQREGAQLPINKKRELADYVIPGDSKELAKQKIREIWAKALGEA